MVTAIQIGNHFAIISEPTHGIFNCNINYCNYLCEHDYLERDLHLVFNFQYI